MSKSIHRLVLPTLCVVSALCITHNSYSSDEASTYIATASANGDESNNELLSSIKTYLYNLGLNIGYNLSTTGPTPPVPTLIFAPYSSDDTLIINLAKSTFLSLFGSIPVNSSIADATLLNFFSTSSSQTSNNTIVTNVTSPLNSLANIAFPSYGTSGQMPTSINTGIDQSPYQQDPVNQAILNIIGTPDITWCEDASSPPNWTGGTSSTNTYPNCQYLYQTQILNNVIGFPYPGTSGSNGLYTTTNGAVSGTTTASGATPQEQILNELNANALIAPLQYSTTQTLTPSAPGLVGSTQAEQAANFIRYVSGSVLTPPVMDQQTYDGLVTTANQTTPSSSYPLSSILSAQNTLGTYIANFRIYAAQTSIAMSNLYYMFAKRLPQNNSNNPDTNTSQALNELTMASRRLYNPSSDANQQWIDMINNASSATVQKEMAILLSEINYQMYLSRQQQERLLLTNSVLLLLALSTHQPITTGTSSSSSSQ